MKVTALEVSLNGKVLYTVGIEGWSSLNASVQGHRFSEKILGEISEDFKEFSPEQNAPDSESFCLNCFVGVPNPDDPSQFLGQPYSVENLVIGDEVTVRVVETDSPDTPDLSNPNGRQTLTYATNKGVQTT